MDAFTKVDDLVSKPILGSDGAKAWQAFAQTSQAAAAAVSKKKKSVAPQAPLKAQERAMGYQTWQDENDAEYQRRQETGQVSVGYTHFKKRPPTKNKGLDDGEFPPEEDDEKVPAPTDKDAPATIDGTEGENTAADVSIDKPTKRKKRKLNKGPTIVHDPTHPLEQVTAALQKSSQKKEEHTNASSLPVGWQSASDPASGKLYYYNSMTGERSWDKPAATASSSSSPSLPEGWTTAVDPTTGKTYYYRAPTQITQWRPPNNSASTS